VVFDEKGPTLRHKEFAEYKAHRPEMPQGMQVQVPYIHRLVEAFGIPAVRAAGYEADDLIGTVARQAEREGVDVVIVTGDKDMYQLLTPSVRIYDPVKDKWIGEKTAIKLITQFGSIEELLRRVQEVTPPKTRTLLVEQADQARLSRKLAVIEVESPVDFDQARFKVKPPPPEPLVALMRELEFSSLLNAVQPAAEADQGLGADVELIQDEQAARRLTDQFSQEGTTGMVGKTGMVGLYVDTNRVVGAQARIKGIAIAGPAGKPAYVQTVQGRLPLPVRELLGDAKLVKATHDLKHMLLALHQEDVKVSPPCFDTMIADYLLNPNRRAHGLDAIALDVLGYQLGVGRSEKSERPRKDLFDDDNPADIAPSTASRYLLCSMKSMSPRRISSGWSAAAGG